MTILLDIDGVLVTTPSWQIPDRLGDGFMQFNATAAQNLLVLYEKTNADIVLTTTHRINYTIEQWHDIFKLRGFDFKNISKINDKTSIETLGNRATEIQEWVEKQDENENYLVIDDDTSINRLSNEIKVRCVQTKPLLGFDDNALQKALSILT
jgi:16S rRNA C1402 (ribose-2'-O) methylase RsmI